jgi:hypothetical protein
VVLTAAVTPSTATGTVTFGDSGATFGTASLAGGVATLDVATLSAGQHSLTAVYGGDANDMGSTSPVVVQTVNRASTTTSFASSPNPSQVGQSVTLTAEVSPVAATGTVEFLKGTTALGTATLSKGKATLPVSTLTAGSHTVTAIYLGDGNHSPSKSAPLTQKVN